MISNNLSTISPSFQANEAKRRTGLLAAGLATATALGIGATQLGKTPELPKTDIFQTSRQEEVIPQQEGYVERVYNRETGNYETYVNGKRQASLTERAEEVLAPVKDILDTDTAAYVGWGTLAAGLATLTGYAIYKESTEPMAAEEIKTRYGTRTFHELTRLQDEAKEFSQRKDFYHVKTINFEIPPDVNQIDIDSYVKAAVKEVNETEDEVKTGSHLAPMPMYNAATKSTQIMMLPVSDYDKFDKSTTIASPTIEVFVNKEGKPVQLTCECYARA